MNEYTNDDQLIEQYLFGNLSGTALRDFEKRMAQDTDFAQQVAIEKSIFSGLEALGNEDLRGQLEQIHQEEIATKPKAKIRRLPAPIRWAIAASVLILMGFFIWNWQSAATPETLFAANYEPLVFDVNRNNDADIALQELAQLYRNKKLRSVYQSIRYLSKKSSSDSKRYPLFGHRCTRIKSVD